MGLHSALNIRKNVWYENSKFLTFVTNHFTNCILTQITILNVCNLKVRNGYLRVIAHNLAAYQCIIIVMTANNHNNKSVQVVTRV